MYVRYFNIDGGEEMKREELIAPEKYNLVSEVERFAKDPQQISIKMGK